MLIIKVTMYLLEGDLIKLSHKAQNVMQRKAFDIVEMQVGLLETKRLCVHTCLLNH